MSAPALSIQQQPEQTTEPLKQREPPPPWVEWRPPLCPAVEAQVSTNMAFLTGKLAQASSSVKRHISIDALTMHGNPVFKGTRIPLYQILEELAEGTSLSEIRDGYPTLSTEAFAAGLDFAASLLRIYDHPVSD